MTIYKKKTDKQELNEVNLKFRTGDVEDVTILNCLEYD